MNATQKHWDHYQGDGGEGPFGFIGGWFINWRVDEDGEMTFELELDKQDIESGDLDEEAVADKDEARETVQAWIEDEQAKEYSSALAKIKSAFRA